VAVQYNTLDSRTLSTRRKHDIPVLTAAAFYLPEDCLIVYVMSERQSGFLLSNFWGCPEYTVLFVRYIFYELLIGTPKAIIFGTIPDHFF
jgi:hypothetical protein